MLVLGLWCSGSPCDPIGLCPGPQEVGLPPSGNLWGRSGCTTREFSEPCSSGFLKTRIRAFFHMWSAQEGGVIYCKCLSDATQPPLSKREFIQEALVTSSRKMPPLWMYTDQSTHPETGWAGSANRKQINRWGREIWLHQNRFSSVLSEIGLWDGKARQTCYHHCFLHQLQGDFPSAWLWKHFLKIPASGLEPGTWV